MCGINGVFNFDGSPVDQNIIQDMNDTIKHRGPDAYGIYLNNNLALGHRRLSIIDLKNGSQPMSSDHNDIHITYNGEVYNYLKLKKELIKKGYIFRTNSDTEVVLKCYQEYGIDFVDKLRGMFAIGIWDERLKQIVLVRDRLGQKPIYYYSDDKKFVFSSELNSILKAFDHSLEIDPIGLKNYLKLDYIPSPYTIYKKIKKLPSAHILLFTNGKLSIKKYWDFNNSPNTNLSPNLDYVELRERLKTLLNESVKIRLMSDVPLGAFLSGGIDSSAIVALMAMNSKKAISTFSIGLKDNDNSELKFAKIIAEYYGTKHHEYIIELNNYELLPKVVSMFGEPFSDPAASYNYYVSKLAKKDVTVALSGDGGDEIFAGYPWYTSLINQGFFNYGGKYSSISSLIYNIWPKYLRGKNKLDLLRQPSASSIYSLMKNRFSDHKRNEIFSTDFIEFLKTDQDIDIIEEFSNDFRESSLLSMMQGTDIKTYLPDDINVKVDRMSMQNSLEVRSPLLDHKLVEFAFNLSDGFKIKNNRQKYIFKDVVKSYLPKEIIERPKQGFGLPSKLSSKDDLNNLYNFSKEILLDQEAKNRKIFKQKNVERLLLNHKIGKTDPSVSYNQIWNLLTLELWLQSSGASINY